MRNRHVSFGEVKAHRMLRILNGKAVMVAGTLEIRRGVEVKARKIVTVDRLMEPKDN